MLSALPSRLIILLLLSSSLVFYFENVAQGQQPSKSKPLDRRANFISAYSAAVAAPFEPAALKTLEQLLPKSGDYFVVEGDILVDERELQNYLASQNGGKDIDHTQELIVATKSDGTRDYYSDSAHRQLTYSIDRRSFQTPQQYNAVVGFMRSAAADWMQACTDCGISFLYKPEFDDASNTTSTNFVVRYRNANATYIAASFFPSDPPLRRYLNVDPSFYIESGYDKVGILRHELGHILGYRHEQIRGIPGCDFEDNQWTPLTPYDPHSVMHYFCGGGGTMELTLTRIDISGHHALYGITPESSTSMLPPADSHAATTATLVVRAEGGDVAQEAAQILLFLHENSLLPTETKPLKYGETLSGVYTSELNLPGPSKDLKTLEAALNPHVKDARKLQAEEAITYPAVRFSNYQFTTKIDPSNPSDVERYKALSKNWTYLSPQIKSKKKEWLITHTGYELRLEVPLDDAVRITEIVNQSRSKNVYATYVDKAVKAPFFSRPDLVEFRTSLMDPKKHFRLGEDEALVGSSIRLPDDIPERFGCYQGKLAHTQDLILIDQPISHHPELESEVDVMIGDKYENPAPDNTGAVTLAYKEFSKKTDHGTHLAGLMVAKKNGFGIAGVNPTGPLVSWNWPQLSPDATIFGIKIRSRVEDGSQPIFVFASQWQKQQQRTLDTYLDSDQALWVVAAGEPSETEPDGQTAKVQPININSPDENVPMGLGQRPYVIVVTACENCYDDTLARIAPYANYSTYGYVNVAAPGDLIPSTVSGGGYGAASGTSQAAAITAGLISTMVDCWPNYYSNQPPKIKFRLQLTAWPGLRYDELDKSLNDAKKLTSGVVDGRAALLDPLKSWLLVSNPNVIADKTYISIRPKSWCAPSLNLRKDGQDAGSLDLREVRRVVRVGKFWYAYAHAISEAGDAKRDAIRRIGPGALEKGGNNVALLNTENGKFTLSQIDDLILSDSVPTANCEIER